MTRNKRRMSSRSIATKRYVIRFSVVPPDASEVFLMIFINPQINPILTAGSDNCAGPVVGGVKVFFSFIPGHSYSRHVHLYKHTDIYTVMLIVWMVKVVFDVLWSLSSRC